MNGGPEEAGKSGGRQAHKRQDRRGKFGQDDSSLRRI